jgi:hypothetical protein
MKLIVFKTRQRSRLKTVLYLLIYVNFLFLQRVHFAQAQLVDPSIQAAFYSKLLPLVNQGELKMVHIAFEKRFELYASKLESELTKLGVRSTKSESIKPSDVLIIVGELAEEVDFHRVARASIVLDYNHFKKKQTTFCLINRSGKLQLISKQEYIKRDKISLDKRLLSVIHFDN